MRLDSHAVGPAPLVPEFPLILTDPGQDAHRLQLEVLFWGNPDPASGDITGMDLHLIYLDGPLANLLDHVRTVWRAECEYPIQRFDPGGMEISLRGRYLPLLLVGRGWEL